MGTDKSAASERASNEKLILLRFDHQLCLIHENRAFFVTHFAHSLSPFSHRILPISFPNVFLVYIFGRLRIGWLLTPLAPTDMLLPIGIAMAA